MHFVVRSDITLESEIAERENHEFKRGAAARPATFVDAMDLRGNLLDDAFSTLGSLRPSFAVARPPGFEARVFGRVSVANLFIISILLGFRFPIIRILHR